MGNLTLLLGNWEGTVSSTITNQSIYIEENVIRNKLGWKFENGVLCKNDRCIQITDEENFILNGKIHLEKLSDVMNRPVAHDIEETVAYVGPPYRNHESNLLEGRAPDFTLPALDGNGYSLTDFRGHKIFLLVWASW